MSRMTVWIMTAGGVIHALVARRAALGLVLGLSLVGGILAVSPTLAQGMSIDDIHAENAALGSGCNPIALGVEGPTAPLAPTQQWIDEHSACTAQGIVAAAQCQGALSGDRRFELCALIVVNGNDTMTVDCQDIQMLTDNGPYGPDPQMIEESIPVFEEAFAGRNLAGAKDLFVPCTSSPTLSDGTAIVSVFNIDRTEGDVAFRTRVGEGVGNQVVFIITDARQEMPS